ncbi:ATP-binding protein [Phytohabitans aurantiacus]|nr:tetratricopeptide repeat protein [Phytohabitans aurantiacus]
MGRHRQATKRRMTGDFRARGPAGEVGAHVEWGTRRLFGELLRRYRQHRAMTQEELARQAGISARQVRDLETGRTARPRPSTVQLLADALGLADTERERFYQAALAIAPPAPASPPMPSGPPRAIPRQLPTRPARFVGRIRELAKLRGSMPSTDVDGRMPVVAISGPGGIGKSWLALRWAHDNLETFPDGQLYVNLRGFDPVAEPMPAAVALRGFLDALGVPPEAAPAEPEALAGRYRSVAAGRRVLVVLDNARDTAHVTPLLPGGDSATVLVTSRRRLTGLVTTHGAIPVRLGLLDDDEARGLLAGGLGQQAAAEPDSVTDILAHCAGLPLALSIAAARAATHPDLPLAALARQLRDDATRLDYLDTDDLTASLRAVFAASCRALTPDAARVFTLLGLAVGPDIGGAAATSLAGSPPAACRVTMRELTDAHLVEQHAVDRYRLHDLVRVYAAECAQSTVERHDALRRLFDHYAELAEAAERHRDPDEAIEPAEPGDFAKREEAVAWFRAEHAVLVATCQQAAKVGFDRHACRLARSLRFHLEDGGHWDELTAVQGTAIGAARRLGDPAAEGNACDSLARAYARLRRYDEAEAHYRRAVDLFRAVADAVGEAHAQRGLGGLCARHGRHDEAFAHNQRAIDLYQAAGHVSGQAKALNNMAFLSAMSGEHQRALALCEEALGFLTASPHRSPEAAIWGTLGFVHQQRGDHRQAIASYRHAVDITRELGERYNEGYCLCRLAEAYEALGDHSAAREARQRALEIFEEIGHPDADEVRAALS